MFKWVIVAVYTTSISDVFEPTTDVFGPYSHREAQVLKEKRDFRLPGQRLLSVELLDLSDARDLPLKLVKLP